MCNYCVYNCQQTKTVCVILKFISFVALMTAVIFNDARMHVEVTAKKMLKICKGDQMRRTVLCQTPLTAFCDITVNTTAHICMMSMAACNSYEDRDSRFCHSVYFQLFFL
jgi:hypothetical protein